MKALIAVDGSASSWDAVTFAARILDGDDHTLVVNVAAPLAPVVVAPGGLSAYAATGYVDSDEHIEQRARAVAGRAAAAVDADDVAVETGDAVQRICAMAEENGIDLIVVGTHDPGVFERIFTGGSVSRGIVDNAPCSVLVVR